MTKEKFLEDIKDCILTAKNKYDELMKDHNLLKKLNEKRKNLADEVENLSKEDRLWVEREYETWVKTIVPNYKKFIK